MQIIAHRGAPAASRHEVPPPSENSLSAFSTALQIGFGGLETDVRLSKDGQLVLVHDRVLPPKTDGGEVEVAYMTKLEIEQSLGRPVPTLHTLQEYFAEAAVTFAVPPLWNIEVKHYAAVDSFSRWLAEANLPGQILVSSFDLDILEDIATVEGVRFGVLTAHAPVNLTDFLDTVCRMNKIDSVVWNFEFLPDFGVDQIRAAGLRQYAWNVLTSRDVAACRKLDLDGIIVDDLPDRLP